MQMDLTDSPTWASFHHCIELPCSALSSSEVWIQDSPCVRQSVPRPKSCSTLRLDRQRNRCPRRLLFGQRVLVIGIVLQLLVSDTVLHASVEKSRILVVRYLSGPTVFAVSARSHLCAPCKQICFVWLFLVENWNLSHALYQPCLTISFVMCSLPFCSPLHPHSLLGEWCVHQ